jgi:hypothetical protein
MGGAQAVKIEFWVSGLELAVDFSLGDRACFGNFISAFRVPNSDFSL